MDLFACLRAGKAAWCRLVTAFPLPVRHLGTVHAALARCRACAACSSWRTTWCCPSGWTGTRWRPRCRPTGEPHCACVEQSLPVSCHPAPPYAGCHGVVVAEPYRTLARANPNTSFIFTFAHHPPCVMLPRQLAQMFYLHSIQGPSDKVRPAMAVLCSTGSSVHGMALPRPGRCQCEHHAVAACVFCAASCHVQVFMMGKFREYVKTGVLW
jgi:hypothetical protein